MLNSFSKNGTVNKFWEFNLKIVLIAVYGITCLPTSLTYAQADTPVAVVADTVRDRQHPATANVIALPSHGVTLNALFLIAAGAGPHPTVLLLHGLPGFEQNMDLARALQRDGWNVLTFHYRGNWGTPGRYSFGHCIEDAVSALEWLHSSTGESAAMIDRTRIVVIGHSLGGFAAAWAGTHDPTLAGVALISASPLGGLAALPRDSIVQAIESNVLNRSGIHTIGDTTSEELADEIIAHRKSWDFNNFSAGLATHPLLVVSSNDPFQKADMVLAKDVESHSDAHVKIVHLETDHSYNDQRIALESVILNWLHEAVKSVR